MSGTYPTMIAIKKLIPLIFAIKLVRNLSHVVIIINIKQKKQFSRFVALVVTGSAIGKTDAGYFDYAQQSCVS